MKLCVNIFPSFQFLIGSLLASCHAFWWGRERFVLQVFLKANDVIIIFGYSTNEVNQVTAPPPVRQFPISYIRAFAYHPVAFPQPLAPITTYHVSRNQQSYNANRNFPANGLNSAMVQAIQQQLIQSQDQSQGGFQAVPQPPMQQQLPQTSQIDFGTPPTTSTTTTTTPAPVTTTAAPQVFAQPAPPILTRSGFSEGYQRQLPIQQQYISGNFGGFPQAYNQPYSQPYNQYNQYSEAANQFSGRLFGGEPTYQQYSTDPLTYQFIPTSITPIANQNNIKFVPCMCPVAVQISPPLAEKRTDEIPILSPSSETESVPQFQPPQQPSEEDK